jgi:MraZ protein
VVRGSSEEAGTKAVMSSHIGGDLYAIDHKGRISIPADLRMGPDGKPLTTLFVNMGFDRCVSVFAPGGWERQMRALRRIAPGDERGRAFKRAFLMDAREVTVDAQGRVPIPPALLRRAGLGKEARLHGNDDHIEIWDPVRYEQKVAPILDEEGAYEKLAEIYLKDPVE